VSVLSAGRRRQVALALPQSAVRLTLLPAGDATAARRQPRIFGQQIKARHGRQPAKVQYRRSKFPRSPRAPAIIRGPPDLLLLWLSGDRVRYGRRKYSSRNSCREVPPLTREGEAGDRRSVDRHSGVWTDRELESYSWDGKGARAMALFLSNLCQLVE